MTVVRRLDSHARSLGHMDRWADAVEARLEDLSRLETGIGPAAAAAAGQQRQPPASGQ